MIEQDMIKKLAEKHGMAFDKSYSSSIPKGRVEYVFTSIEHLEAFAKDYHEAIERQRSNGVPAFYARKDEVGNTTPYLMITAQNKKDDVYDTPLFTAPQQSPIPQDIIEAMSEVIRISDRKHDAWDKAKELIAKIEAK